MAKNISIGVDIGNNQVKVVQLRKTSNGVRIDKFFIEDYGLTSVELESAETRMKAVAGILSKIFKDLKPLSIALAVSKSEENVRTVLLPVMTEKQLREVLKFGGQQDYIPFDLNDMIWDINISHFYRRKEEIKTEGKEKMEVVFAVAKKAVVNAYLDLADKLKCSIEVLDSSLLSNLNFSLYNMPMPKDKIWSKLDVGAETTSVNVLEGDSLKFGLNVPWGVNDIVETAQQVLSLDWSAAKDFVSKMDFSKDPSMVDEKTKMVYSAFESKLKDFLRQLNGAFSFFESKSSGRIVSEVYLSGGATKLLNFNKFISAKINKTVKTEGELNKSLISYDKGQEAALLGALPQLGTAIGVALRSLLPVRNNINLLPREIIIGRELKSRRSLVIVSAACILLVLLLGTGYKIKLGADIQSQIDASENVIAGEDAVIKELRMKKKALDRIKGLTTRYTNHTKFFKKWSEILYELTTIVPDTMWFDTAEWNVGGFDSTGFSKEDVAKDLVANGKASKNFPNLTCNTRETNEGSIFFRAYSKREKLTTTKPLSRSSGSGSARTSSSTKEGRAQ